MGELRVIGCSPWDDLYPNVKHRVAQIQSLSEFDVVVDVHHLDPKQHRTVGVVGFLRYAVTTFWAALSIAIKAKKSRADLLYVTYPSSMVLTFLRLLRVQRHATVHADIFISISETLIFDRGRLKPGSLTAKLVRSAERFGLRGVICIVDTPENAEYLADYFSMPASQFQDCPLMLAPRSQPVTLSGDQEYAYFVGTLVPLQGVAVLADTYLHAQQKSDVLPLVIRGDGQDAAELHRAISLHPANDLLQWRHELADPEIIENEIDGATICLGIFGKTAKAQRVIPFKIYQYLRAGRVVITLRTPALTTLEQKFLQAHDGPSPFILVDPDALHDAFVTALNVPNDDLQIHLDRSKNARRCYEYLLDPTQSSQRLLEIFGQQATSAK